MEEKTEYPEKLDLQDGFELNLGAIRQTVPLFILWPLAESLKKELLDRYEIVEGVPTGDNPNPMPHLRLKGIQDNG